MKEIRIRKARNSQKSEGSLWEECLVTQRAWKRRKTTNGI